LGAGLFLHQLHSLLPGNAPQGTMVDLLPVTANSRSIAMRFEPDTAVQAGSGLNLTTSPEATAVARTISSGDPTRAAASARGLGAGYSRYYAGLVDESFFNSRNLSIAAGGGLINGDAVAEAYATGRGPTSADAVAFNVGLANVAYLDQYGVPLRLNISAKASSGTDSVLGPIAGTRPSTDQRASATARGLEGSGGASAPSFYGQPNAVVSAEANLGPSDPAFSLNGSASADAVAIEGYGIKAVPRGNGNDTASIKGSANALLRVDRADLADDDRVTLNGQAIGIQQSTLFGAPLLATTIEGRGIAQLAAAPAGSQLQSLRGIGIGESLLFTNQGKDVIRGFGGMVDRNLPLAAGADPSSRDAAGFDRSGIYSGLGDDIIFGKVLSELDADIDADGDGITEANVFLDRSAGGSSLEQANGGFDGIRNSTVNSGIGNDLIVGASNGSHLYTDIGDDSIDLDRAKASSLWGGIGNDLLSINGPGENNVLWGGIGNDSISVNSGNGNVLDGGYGQDVTSGGSGVDRFILSEAGAAIRAASSSIFGEDLADKPLWASMSQAQKDSFWETGRLVNGSGSLVGAVDTIRNFQAGSGGDILELSSSLAGITQDLWDSKGALYSITNAGQLDVLEASADGSNKVGIIVGTLSDIQRLGIGSPQIAYATDTRQLMFDADGDWSQGSTSIGTVNVSGGSLSKSNFAFGSSTGNGLGAASTAQGGLG
jgi:hypothetical protein